MAAAAVKRSSLRLGMIPADGIGKEVLPVSLGIKALSYYSINNEPAFTYSTFLVSASRPFKPDELTYHLGCPKSA